MCEHCMSHVDGPSALLTHRPTGSRKPALPGCPQVPGMDSIQNLFPFHAFGKQTQDQGDGDAHAPNAGAPALHVGIKGDAIQEAVVSNPP